VQRRASSGAAPMWRYCNFGAALLTYSLNYLLTSYLFTRFSEDFICQFSVGILLGDRLMAFSVVFWSFSL